MLYQQNKLLTCNFKRLNRKACTWHLALGKHMINSSEKLIGSRVQCEQSNVGKYKTCLGRTNDPDGWMERGRGRGQGEGLVWRNELIRWAGSIPGVLRAKLRSLNFIPGSWKLLTKVSGEVVGWGHAGDS